MPATNNQPFVVTTRLFGWIAIALAVVAFAGLYPVLGHATTKDLANGVTTPVVLVSAKDDRTLFDQGVMIATCTMVVQGTFDGQLVNLTLPPQLRPCREYRNKDLAVSYLPGHLRSAILVGTQDALTEGLVIGCGVVFLLGVALLLTRSSRKKQ
jgi:hypothetical protein